MNKNFFKENFNDSPSLKNLRCRKIHKKDNSSQEVNLTESQLTITKKIINEVTSKY